MSVHGTISDEMLARYVLGELPPAEREDVEAAYFSDESVHERLMATEEELFDAYARGYLSGEQRKRFEALHLCSQQDRDRLAFSRAFCQFIDQYPAPLPAESKSILSSTGPLRAVWPFRLFSSESSFYRFALPAVFAAILLSAIFVLLRTHPSQPPTPAAKLAANKETPRPNSAQRVTQPERPSQQHGPSQETLPIFAFSLVPGTRDAGNGINVIRIPETPATIRLKIALERLDYARYRVSIERLNGGSELRLPAHTVGHRSAAVYVDIASDQLNPGDYVLELWGLTPNHADEEVGGYGFKVEPKS